MARQAAEAVSDKLATNIAVLDVREVCTFASFFVICSAESDRQIEAICDEIEAVLKKAGTRLLHREGSSGSGWALCDFGGVIVHVFTPETRNFYRFDDLWEKAVPIVKIQ
ncbi:MAG: ribosome silencing factor [Dehalococcoidales bacterium]|nr:ribosome silencing factor [Dehalococcoidales bacterium]